MIKLRNLKRNDNIIECEVVPEDSMKGGYIQVDLESNTIVHYELPDGYEWCKKHIQHAKLKLIELSELVDLPEEKLIMWN